MKRRREQLWEEEEEEEELWEEEEEEEEELWEEEPQEDVIYWEETVRWAHEEEEDEFGEEELERELEEEPREEEEEEVEEEFDEEEFERELEEALREEEEEEEEEKKFPFQELPPELHQYIIHQLSSLEDIFNFCLTSKTNWCSICENSDFWLERARQENLSPTLTKEQFQRQDTTPLLVYLSLYIKKYNQLPISPNRLIRFLLFSPTNIVQHIDWLLKYNVMSLENIIDLALERDDDNIISGLISSPSTFPYISLKTIYNKAKKDKRRKILKVLEDFRKMGWSFLN